MRKYLEYKDLKSEKFWQVIVEGNTHTVTYGKVGTNGQSKTKTFEDSAKALADANKLVASKLKKGYQEVQEGAQEQTTASIEINDNNPLLKLTEDSILSHYDWPDFGENHSNCPQLLKELEDTDANAIAHVVKTTLQTFSFEQSGGWCPSWMKGDRKKGSPLHFLDSALALLFKKDEKTWITLASEALPYILCEGEALDHDEGEMWDSYSSTCKELLPYYEKASKSFPIKEILASLEQQFEIIGSSIILKDPFTLAFALLESEIATTYKQKVVQLLTGFLTKIEFSLLDVIKQYSALNDADCKAYADRLRSLEIADDLFTQLSICIFEQEMDASSDYFCGSICGKDSSDFYFPTLHKKDNKYCAIVHVKDGVQTEIGQFSVIPKVMEYTSQELYFVLKNKIYRYSDRNWFFEMEADFDIYHLKSIDDVLYALGNGNKLFFKSNNKWDSAELPSSHAYSKIAKSPDGELWISGTKGLILKLDASKKSTIIDPVDKVKINYRLTATKSSLYLNCKTGLYKLDLAKPKKLVADNFKFSVEYNDSICAVSREQVVFANKSKVKHKVKIEDVSNIGAIENGIGFSIKDKILLLSDGTWTMLFPEVTPSETVNLPKKN